MKKKEILETLERLEAYLNRLPALAEAEAYRAHQEGRCYNKTAFEAGFLIGGIEDVKLNIQTILNK